MDKQRTGLAALLDPVTPAHFLEEFWERRHLHVQRGCEDFYHGLLTVADVDSLVSSPDARYPTLRLVKDGGFYPPEAYSRDIRFGDDAFTGVPDVEKIYTEYLAGATVRVSGLHRTWSPLIALCGAIEAQLDHAVHVNAYITPARAAGFSAHYDSHEVFVLQIAGAKSWRIDPPPIPLPHRSQTFSPQAYVQPAKPWIELEMKAGDLLYLPRGYVHSTTTSDRFSLHLTLGVTVYTGFELLADLLQASLARPAGRQSLPPGFASHPELRPALKVQLAGLVARLADDAELERAIDRFTSQVRNGRVRTAGRFLSDTGAMSPGTWFEITDRQAFRLEREGDNPILDLDGRRVRFPVAAWPVLQEICKTPRFQAQGLPDRLSLDARLSLLRYLFGLGFLRLAGGSS